MRKKLGLLALLFAVALVATACPKEAEEAKKKQVKLVFVGPLTGSVANLGIPARNGAELAIKQANESGDLDVEILFEDFDTQGDPAQATQLKDDFIPDEKVIGVIGPTFSGETEAVIPDLEAEGLAMISASATRVTLPTKPLQNPKIFHRVVPDDDIQGKGVTDYVTKIAKLTGLTYVHDNQAYGQALAEGTKGLLDAAGVKTIGNVLTVDPKQAVYSDTVNAIVSAKPPAVYFGGYYDTAGKLAKQLNDAGYKGQFLGGDGVLDVGFIENAGSTAAEGAVMTCACRLATEDAENKELAQFAKDYKAEYDVAVGTYGVEGYDAANIFIEAIKAGNDTREEILTYLEEEFKSHDGLSKKISFQDNGNVTTGEVNVYQVKNGKIELLGAVSELT